MNQKLPVKITRTAIFLLSFIIFSFISTSSVNAAIFNPYYYDSTSVLPPEYTPDSPAALPQCTDSQGCSDQLFYCWNDASAGTSDCGTACSGGNSWKKYQRQGCWQTSIDEWGNENCSTTYTVNENSCSSGDKYNSNNPPVMNAGYCDCTPGGAYKTCCNGTTLVNASHWADDPYAPDEAGCGSSNSTVRCGGWGEPACGQAACGNPPPTCPTKTCDYTQAVTVTSTNSSAGCISGVASYNGIGCTGTNCSGCGSPWQPCLNTDSGPSGGTCVDPPSGITPKINSATLDRCENNGRTRTLVAHWDGSDNTADCNIYFNTVKGDTGSISKACKNASWSASTLPTNGTAGGTVLPGSWYKLLASDGDGNDGTDNPVDGGTITCDHTYKCSGSPSICIADDTNGTFNTNACGTGCSNPWATLTSDCSGTTPRLQADWNNLSGSCNVGIYIGSCFYQISTSCSGPQSNIVSLTSTQPGCTTPVGVATSTNYTLTAWYNNWAVNVSEPETAPSCTGTAKYKCSSDTCTRDDAVGTFTTSNCDNTCSTCGGVGEPSCCDTSRVSMSISSNPNPATVGNTNTISFSVSGVLPNPQGSTSYDDSWSGGTNCSGSFWNTTKTCTPTSAVSNATWTHTWRNCAPNNCSILYPPAASNPCSKTANYTINNSLSVTCSVSPASVPVGTQTTWTASATGGTGLYTYAWSGTDSLSGATQSIYKTYTTTGIKTGTVTVTSGTQTATCSKTLTVTVSPWIQVWGDVHSNTKIAAPGGP